MAHEAYELKAEARERVGKGSARNVRRNGKVPAVIYGDKQAPLAIALTYKDVYMKIHGGGFLTTIATIDLDGPILELGPGLGVVTRTLLEHGVAPERITSIEYDSDFARQLQRRFPGVNVINGDGFDLDRTLGDRRDEKFAAILMAIPIVSFSQEKRQALFTDYLSRLMPGGNLTELSYMLTPPVRPVPGVFSVSSSPRVWNNIPPARVWIYSQDTAPAENAATAS